jgi:hemoglobin-like flavoprotein
MSPQQTYHIRKSFAIVEEHSHIAALVFYRRLFTLAPELRPLFKTDIEVQARKLMDMLGVLITMIERAAALEAELRELGARHAAYGVRNSHYQIVGRALLDMLAEVCGNAFTPEVRDAWTALYDAVSAGMKAGAQPVKV